MEKIESLKKQIAEHTEALERLKGLRAASKKRVEALHEQGRSRLIDWSFHGSQLIENTDARKAVEKHQSEIAAALREDSDAAGAIEQVSQKIASLNAELSHAAKEQQREEARKLIQKRLDEKREQRINDLAMALRKEIDALAENTGEIGRSLEAFDRSLRFTREDEIFLSCWFDVRTSEEEPGSYVKYSTARLKNLLTRLDSIEIPGEARAGEKDLAETAAT
jgi:DNA repair exonuclease SbcCD ATPase subunit